jgi:hypothetical protein
MIVSQIPLKSSRPPAREQAAVLTIGEQKVQARLWQDPFAAVREHERHEVEEERKHRHPLEELVGLVAAEIAALSEREKLAVFLVLTDGSAYAENTEQRIRQRVALGSGLGVACFVPEDSEHISFFALPSEGTSLPTLHVPFEWYRPHRVRACWDRNLQRERTQYAKALVLWLKDDAFSSEPLSQLSKLLTALTDRLKEPSPGKRLNENPFLDKLDLKLMGPWGSSSLLQMLRDSCEGKRIQTPQGIGTVALYLSSATASPEMLRLSLQAACRGQQLPDDAEDWLSLILKRGNLKSVYRIPSDFEVMKAIRAELFHRGLAIGSDHIALISEWDTFYGRSLPLEFTAVFCMDLELLKQKCDRHLDALKYVGEHENIRELKWIRWYSYLRGVDGEIAPGEKLVNEREKL